MAVRDHSLKGTFIDCIITTSSHHRSYDSVDYHLSGPGPRVSCSSRYLSIECCRGLVHFYVPASSVHFSHVVPIPQCCRLHPYLHSHYNHDVTEILPYNLRLNLMQVHSDGSVRFGVTCGDLDHSYGQADILTHGHVPIKTLSYQISSDNKPLIRRSLMNTSSMRSNFQP